MTDRTGEEGWSEQKKKEKEKWGKWRECEKRCLKVKYGRL